MFQDIPVSSEPTPETDQRVAALAQTIGDCVMAWARVETGLFNIFYLTAGINPKLAASITENFKTFSLLLEVTDASVCWKFADQKQIIFWKSLAEFVRELSGDRNYIVHTNMVLHQDGPPIHENLKRAVPKIGPTTSSLFTGNRRREPIEKEELNEIYNDIEHANRIIWEFCGSIQTVCISQQRFCEPIQRRRLSRSERLASAQKVKYNLSQSSPKKAYTKQSSAEKRKAREAGGGQTP